MLLSLMFHTHTPHTPPHAPHAPLSSHHSSPCSLEHSAPHHLPSIVSLRVLAPLCPSTFLAPLLMYCGEPATPFHSHPLATCSLCGGAVDSLPSSTPHTPHCGDPHHYLMCSILEAKKGFLSWIIF